MDLKFLRQQRKRFPHEPQWKIQYYQQLKLLKELRRNIGELRQRFLQGQLATTHSWAISRIITAESKRLQFAQVKSLFTPSYNPLNRILYDIESTSDPTQIESILIERNQNHLNQAHSTPVTISLSSTYITPSPNQWRALLSDSIPTSLPPDAQNILQEIKRIAALRAKTNPSYRQV